jgi:hypothetical protein
VRLSPARQTENPVVSPNRPALALIEGRFPAHALRKELWWRELTRRKKGYPIEAVGDLSDSLDEALGKLMGRGDQPAVSKHAGHYPHEEERDKKEIFFPVVRWFRLWTSPRLARFFVLGGFLKSELVHGYFPEFSFFFAVAAARTINSP